MFRRGEPKPRGAGVHTQSRFWLDVSERAFEDFEGQIQDVIAFLSSSRWLPLLEAAAQAPDLERCLVFGITWPDVENIGVQCDYLPPELVELAGRYRIGIAVDHYP